MQIQIEKNIPLPARKPQSRAEKYPLSQLNVGESFLAPIKSAALASHARRVAKSMDRKFVVRPEGEGARVWRKS